MVERRKKAERRIHTSRRRPAGDSVDVTRLEHENLYDQVEGMLRSLRRIEDELQETRQRIGALERDLEKLIDKTIDPA